MQFDAFAFFFRLSTMRAAGTVAPARSKHKNTTPDPQPLDR